MISRTFLFCTVSLLAVAVWGESDLEFFEKQVRPLLAANCYKCHSVESKKLKGDLLLDHIETVKRGGDSGPSIVLGEPDKSLLIETIRYKNVDMQMPPKGKLADEEIKVLETWVAMGAPWPDEPVPVAGNRETFDWKARKAEHWCWQAIAEVQPPSVSKQGWEQPIDRFIMAAQQAAGLSPATPADDRTWIRRVTLDLIGLPPTVSEVDAFLADHAEGARDRVVDRLLASPHFGERWARHWLDLVRYAESYGHEFDYNLAGASGYRNYVIRALNANLPYDEFVREQVAGDLLPNPRLHPEEGYNESVIGTGFWYMHEAVHAPTDVRKDEAERMDNQIDVFSKAFLGLTVSCARCHDHKFDAIPTSDYYALAGYLQSSRMDHAMLDPGSRIATAAKQLKELRAREQAPVQDIATALVAAHALETWTPPSVKVEEEDIDLLEPPKSDDVPAAEDSANTQAGVHALSKQYGVPAAVIETLANSPAKDRHHPLHVWHQLRKAKDIPAKRQGLAAQLTKQQTDFDAALAKAQSIDVADCFIKGEAFGDGPQGGVMSSKHLSKRLHGVLRTPTFLLAREVWYRVRAEKAEVRLIIDSYMMQPMNGLLFNGTRQQNLDTKGEWQWHRLGNSMYQGHRAYLEFNDRNDGFLEISHIVVGSRPPDPPKPIHLEVASNPSVVDLATLLKAVSTSLYAQGAASDLGIHKADVGEKIARIEQKISKPRTALAMADGSGEDEFVFIRGSHKNLGEVAPRRLPIAIAGEEQPAHSNKGSGRLEMVERMLDPANPFPARVMVNRLWHHLFGRGIVPSVDDFGVMGQAPSHPELLDWLAIDFRNDWDVKRAIKQMVLSSTYAQSSAPDDATASGIETKDPDNVLLHRMPIRRLQAEAIRDSVLAVSGRLNKRMYGGPVGVHLTNFQQGRGRPKSGPLDGDGRRSIYLSVRRNFLSSFLWTYDFPTPFSTIGKRTVSNVPAQALVLMNDPFVVAEAKRWGQAIAKQPGSAEEKVGQLYRKALAREPLEHERNHALAFLESQAKTLRRPVGDPALWADLCHVIFNLKEFIYIP